MYRYLLLANFLFLLCSTEANAQEFQWAHGVGSTGSDLVTDMITDEMGNVYTAGMFVGTVDFDPGPGEEISVSGILNAPFLQKLDPSGNLLWVYTLSDSARAYLNSCILDSDGNILLTGQFSGTVDFGNGGDPYWATAMGWDDLFVLKLDAYGELLWLKVFPSTYGGNGNEIRMDADGNIIVSGTCIGTTDFDPTDGGVFEIVTPGHSDAFIMKLNNDGNLLWVKTIGDSAEYQSIIGMDIDTDGNIYCTGRFQGSIDFDPGPTEYILSSVGYHDIFVHKLNSDGEFQWVYPIGSSGSDIARNIYVDSENDILITGSYTNTVDFDPGPGEAIYNSSGYIDGFIQKVDSEGNLIWVNTFGSAGEDNANQIREGATGNLYVVGSFEGIADFDPGDDFVSLPSHGEVDCFLLKMNSNGNFIDAVSFGGTGYDKAITIAIGNDNSLYIGGFFKQIVDFDLSDETHEVIGDLDEGSVDLFILKWGNLAVDGITESPQAVISVYPNPSNGNFSFSYNQHEIEQVSVYDQRGATVLSFIPEGQNHQVDLSDFENGLYFLNVQLISGEILNQKLIKR